MGGKSRRARQRAARRAAAQAMGAPATPVADAAAPTTAGASQTIPNSSHTQRAHHTPPTAPVAQPRGHDATDRTTACSSTNASSHAVRGVGGVPSQAWRPGFMPRGVPVPFQPPARAQGSESYPMMGYYHPYVHGPAPMGPGLGVGMPRPPPLPAVAGGMPAWQPPPAVYMPMLVPAPMLAPTYGPRGQPLRYFYSPAAEPRPVSTPPAFPGGRVPAAAAFAPPPAVSTPRGSVAQPQPPPASRANRRRQGSDTIRTEYTDNPAGPAGEAVPFRDPVARALQREVNRGIKGILESGSTAALQRLLASKGGVSIVGEAVRTNAGAQACGTVRDELTRACVAIGISSHRTSDLSMPANTQAGTAAPPTHRVPGRVW